MDARHRQQILIVEDEEPLAVLLKMRLELMGYDVHTEGAGNAALHYAAEHPIDLAILDVNLPDLNGYEVCRALRKFSNPWVLPILMLTVRDKPIDQLRGFAHGADAYLTKPFTTAELCDTVKLLTGEAALTHGQDTPV